MNKLHIIPVIFIVFVSCTGNDKADSMKTKESKPADTKKHVDWEIGPDSNLNKVLQFYKNWDDKKPFVTSEWFADTFRLNMPEVEKETVVPNDQIASRLSENRDLYKETSNDILSSVSLHDKVTGEDWVMLTIYSKWTEQNGARDSVLYHDDWRLANGKINMLISFYKSTPKGFSNIKEKK